VAQGNGEWGLRSVHHTLSLPLLPPQREDPSHSAPAPTWGPSHGRQASTNCSSVSPSRGVQLFMNCPSMGPPWGHKPCQQTCSSVGSPLHRSTAPAGSQLQCGRSMGSQPPSGIHLLWHGVLPGLQVDICSTIDLHGLQGHSLPHHDLHLNAARKHDIIKLRCILCLLEFLIFASEIWHSIISNNFTGICLKHFYHMKLKDVHKEIVTIPNVP